MFFYLFANHTPERHPARVADAGSCLPTFIDKFTKTWYIEVSSLTKEKNMGFFRQILRWFSKKQKTKKTEVIQTIQTPQLITPKEFFNDCMRTLSSRSSTSDEYPASYLQEKMREKADNNSLRKKYVRNSNTLLTKIVRGHGYCPKFLLSDGAEEIVLVQLDHAYEDLLRNKALPDLLIQVMMTPFLVMIYDLEIGVMRSELSWYHKAKEKIKEERRDAQMIEEYTVTDDQKARVAAVISRLTLFEAELEKIKTVLMTYCEDSIAYIKTLRGLLQELIAEELLVRLERRTEETTQEITAMIRSKYDALASYNLQINNGISIIDTCTNEQRLSEISQETLIKLEKERAKLQITLDEGRKKYFGDAIVAYGKETA